MAKVSAKYYGGTNDAELSGVAMTRTGGKGGDTDITFGAGQEKEESATLSPAGEIKLDSTNKFVVFEYKFESTGERDFNASMTFTGTLKNVKVYVEKSNNEVISTTEFNGEEKFQSAESPTGEIDTSKTFNITETKVDGTDSNVNKVVYIYVKVAIDDIGKDAAFSGGFAWTLKAGEKAA